MSVLLFYAGVYQISGSDWPDIQLFFNIQFHLWIWQKSCKLLDIWTLYFTYLLQNVAAVILVKFKFVINKTEAWLKIKNWLSLLTSVKTLPVYLCMKWFVVIYAQIYICMLSQHYDSNLVYWKYWPDISSHFWQNPVLAGLQKMESGTSLILCCIYFARHSHKYFYFMSKCGIMETDENSNWVAAFTLPHNIVCINSICYRNSVPLSISPSRDLHQIRSTQAYYPCCFATWYALQLSHTKALGVILM